MKNLTDFVFDVAIIGGGINGAGVARDCAMRRLSVAFFEKDDLCAGSTGACSGMIHGGPRYLETERETTRKSCEDSAAIQRIAPNLLFRIPMLIPTLRSDPKIYLEMIETFCTAYDRFSSIKGGKPHVRLSESDVKQIDTGFSDDIVGAISLDEWGIDPFRLVVLNAKSAVMAGAQFFPRTRVENIVIQNKTAIGLNVVPDGGTRSLVRARTIVNLAGPWAPFIDPKTMPSIKMRPSKGVHLVLDRRVVNISMICKAIDGRESVFILPHEHTTLIGTTDDDYYGHPDHIEILQDEVGYLMQAVSRYFPSLPECRIMRAFAGIRPTLYGWGIPESSLSRDHAIFDHSRDGADGVYTMIGGKLAAYRLMAEEMTNTLCQKLKRRAQCRTHLELLPGCSTDISWIDETRRSGLDPITVKRLIYRHGLRATDIIDRIVRDPEMAQTLCECDQVTAGEIAYCIEEEWASRPADVRRRTRLGMGPCQSCRCSQRTALFMAKQLNWNAAETEAHARQFLERRWGGNQPVLFGEQAKQEEYARYLHCMSRPQEGSR